MNIKIIKSWDMFFNHMVFMTIWVHRRVQPVQKLTTLQKRKPLPRNQDKAQALQSWLHETAPARKEAFEQVRAPRGLIRQMRRWLKWMSWSKLKLTMKYHETMKHSELFDIFDERSWHQLFFEVPEVEVYNLHPALRPLKPCFTVGLTPGPKPLVVVGISSDFFSGIGSAVVVTMFSEQSSFSTWAMEGYGTFIQHPTIWIYMELLREKHRING